MGARLIVVGSVVFLFGAALGVPSVFMTADMEERVRLLTAGATRWRVAQLPYGLGPVVAAIGVTEVGLAQSGRASTMSGGVLLLVGALAWVYCCCLRGVDPVAFAQGRQPAWPFNVYVVATLVGLGILGVTLAVTGDQQWLGWTVLGADAVFVVLYARTHDIPPFVFYLLLLVVGVAL